jgi:glyoxylase-like metal-dependent hydrolase (beta-lactamase superfamily II)
MMTLPALHRAEDVGPAPSSAANSVRCAGPALHRRRLLAAAAVAPWCLHAAPAWADDTAIEVEAGVYMVPGLAGALSPANGGRTGNAGFIVGRSAVMAIDSGTSHTHGEALLAAIAQVTPLPVRLLLVTHVRQEFVFGASAFQARGIPVHMQRNAAALMAARCDNCLKTLRTELGEEAMRGTVVFKPDHVFDHTHVIETIGRPVLVQHHGHASGPGDTSAFDVRSGTLFAGGLLGNRRIPDIQDSDLDGWRRALGSLHSLRISTIVPGHGPAAGPELIAENQRYLAQLERRCATLLEQGAALSEVPDAATLPEFSRWDQTDGVHRRNAAIMFLRLESRLLRDEPAQGAPR